MHVTLVTKKATEETHGYDAIEPMVGSLRNILKILESAAFISVLEELLDVDQCADDIPTINQLHKQLISGVEANYARYSNTSTSATLYFRELMRTLEFSGRKRTSAASGAASVRLFSQRLPLTTIDHFNTVRVEMVFQRKPEDPVAPTAWGNGSWFISIQFNHGYIRLDIAKIGIGGQTHKSYEIRRDEGGGEEHNSMLSRYDYLMKNGLEKLLPAT